jgi:hypothetical protein
MLFVHELCISDSDLYLYTHTHTCTTTHNGFCVIVSSSGLPIAAIRFVASNMCTPLKGLVVLYYACSI